MSNKSSKKSVIKVKRGRPTKAKPAKSIKKSVAHKKALTGSRGTR